MKKSVAQSKARELQAYGFQVVAINGNSKVQIGQGGKLEVAADVFNRIHKAPSDDVNLAVCPTADLLVLDVDVKNGAKGLDSYHALCERFATLHPTVTPRVITPSNGFHRYFRVPVGFKLTGMKLPEYPDIDFLYDNNYALCPPSTINGKAYAWEVGLEECPIADLPEDLCAFLQASSGTATSRIDLRAISLLRPAVGCRHDHFLREAGSLLSHYSPEKTLALLLPHSRAVGFPDAELEAIIESLGRKEQAKAKAMDAGRFEGMKETEFDPTPLSESVDFLEEEAELPVMSTAASYHFPPLYKEGEVEGEINKPTLVGFNEFINSAPLHFNWRVQGFYPEVGVNSIAAVPGVGKSWAAMDLALATATGAKWLNHFQTNQSAVLYVDFENSHQQISRRFRRILRAYNLSPAEVPNFNFLRADSIMLDTDKGKKVVELAMTQTGAKLVVFDSLMRIHSGEENSSTDMGKVSRSLISLANNFQACLVLVDHLGKGQGAGLRGSTEKRAALETILEFSDFGNKTIKAQVTKFRPTGEDWDPFLIKLEDPTEDSTMLRYMAMDEKDDALSRDTEVEWVLEYLKSVGGSASRQDVIKIAKQAQGWGEKRTSGVLNRGLGRELWTWVPSISEKNRPQYTVQLTPFGLGDKLL